MFKEAPTETLHEQRELLYEVFVEVLEDLALPTWLRQGRQAERVERDEVFDVLEDKAYALLSGEASYEISEDP